ncbi:Hypothetical protein PBC10988_9330 [Planctomycetales bacterium 10988]|nr:Hypothetical protein PBC10988_9330 [Planctomycetales bacterium 10988]
MLNRQAHKQQESAWPGSPAGQTELQSQQALQFTIARSLEKEGKNSEALGAYDKCIKLGKNDAEVYHRMAIVYDKIGEHLEAREFYKKALEKKPGDPEIYCDMGYSMYLQRRWSEAEMNLRQALAVDKFHGRSYNNLGLVLVRQNQVDEAVACFHRGGCSEEEVHTNIAVGLAMDGNLEKAREHYEYALNANPGSQTAKMGLARLDRVNQRFQQGHPGMRSGEQLARKDPPKPATRPEGLLTAPKSTIHQVSKPEAKLERLPKPIDKPVIQRPTAPKTAAIQQPSQEVVRIPTALPVSQQSVVQQTSQVTVQPEAPATQAEPRQSSLAPSAPVKQVAPQSPELEFAPGSLLRDRYQSERE